MESQLSTNPSTKESKDIVTTLISKRTPENSKTTAFPKNLELPNKQHPPPTEEKEPVETLIKSQLIRSWRLRIRLRRLKLQKQQKWGLLGRIKKSM